MRKFKFLICLILGLIVILPMKVLALDKELSPIQKEAVKNEYEYLNGLKRKENSSNKGEDKNKESISVDNIDSSPEELKESKEEGNSLIFIIAGGIILLIVMGISIVLYKKKKDEKNGYVTYKNNKWF